MGAGEDYIYWRQGNEMRSDDILTLIKLFRAIMSRKTSEGIDQVYEIKILNFQEMSKDTKIVDLMSGRFIWVVIWKVNWPQKTTHCAYLSLSPEDDNS